MARFSSVLLALIFSVSAARAEWSIVSTESEFSAEQRVEHRHVVVRSATDEATLELAIYSSKTATLRVVDNPSHIDSLGGAMRREKCIAGVNGGYFDPADAPVGLLVVNGKTISPFVRARLLSGVLATRDGRAQIYRAGEFPRGIKWKTALQCGPFLIDRGRAVTGLEATRRARRSFVGSGSADRTALGFSSHVSLAQLAEILAIPGLMGDGKMQRALNLDGGSSSAFWFQGKDGEFSIAEQKTVRDFVGICPRR